MTGARRKQDDADRGEDQGLGAARPCSCYPEKLDGAHRDEDAGSIHERRKRIEKEAKEREESARLWLTGLEAVNEKIGVRGGYDLSATPFYLKGSGYPEGTLFPWVVSDFSLIDAIESGIVKIPRVPVAGVPCFRSRRRAMAAFWLSSSGPLASPAEHVTHVEHAMELPTAAVRRDLAVHPQGRW